MKKRTPIEIPHRNRSPYGWWVASFIERFEWKTDDRSKPNRLCLAYENTILIKAPDRESAYKKALKTCQSSSEKWQNYGDERPGRWVVEGLTSLLPIYEKLEDGAEIIWHVYAGKRVSKIRSRVKSKQQLECFRD